MAVIVFNSTNHALTAEKALEDADIDINIVPLPKELSADCGLAIEFDAGLRKRVETVLGQNHINYKGIF